MRAVLVLMLFVLAGCDLPPPAGGVPLPAPPAPATPAPVVGPTRATANFVDVVETMRPVAVNTCEARTLGVRCDYAIVIDDRPGLPPNAFQTVTPDGRPLVGFTLALIAQARNRDELAFILGHEAAHHILGHIPRTRRSAAVGALALGVLATLGGADAAVVRRARNIGAAMGARRFAKGFELEADALGTVIATRAGFDAVRGAKYFARAPDPGNRFLGTHPPNAERIATVRRVAAGL